MKAIRSLRAHPAATRVSAAEDCAVCIGPLVGPADDVDDRRLSTRQTQPDDDPEELHNRVALDRGINEVVNREAEEPARGRQGHGLGSAIARFPEALQCSMHGEDPEEYENEHCRNATHERACDVAIMWGARRLVGKRAILGVTNPEQRMGEYDRQKVRPT